MSSQVQFFTVSDDEQGQRLDNYLLTRLKGVPKSAIYKVIRKGQVRVNKGRVKPDYRISAGDIVRVPPLRLAAQGELPPVSAQLSERLRAAVLFDEAGLLIINKPAGLAVHGGSGVNIGMIEALRQLPEYPGFLELVHRLDRDTSGCVMIARKRAVLKLMQEHLRARSAIKKRYLALVHGQWPKHLEEIDVPLQRLVLASGERIVKVHQDGKPSQTIFKVLQRYNEVTLVEATPVTGRTHQIRVHAQHAGCPLVGDSKYANQAQLQGLPAGSRMFLHAAALELSLPAPFNHTVEAPLPEELKVSLQHWS